MSARILIAASGLLFVAIVSASPPKKYNPDERFHPLQRYQESNINEFNRNSSTLIAESKISKEQDRLRFGGPLTTNFGNTGAGVPYGGGQGGGYLLSPMKIDVGGIALGAIIGLSAVLIIPKLSHIFSGGYGYRSIENEMSSVGETLARVDNFLEQYNVDSSTCMQRVVCNYVNEAQKNMKNGEATTVDQFIYSLTSNSLFSFMLDGTAVKEAIEMGKKGDLAKCNALEEKCPLSKEHIVKIVASLLPA